MKSRIPSPARSLGPPVTPRRLRTGRSRSVGSPAGTDAPDRLSAISKNVRLSRGSFGLTPVGRKSVLTDNTEIVEPRRKSWWKNLDDNSRDIMEVLHSDNVNNTDDSVKNLVNVEVLSQEPPNISLGIPDSSDNETIGSIVLPQRRLFTEKENLPQKKFGKVVGTRETLAKLQKTTTEADKTVNMGPKKLFSQGPSKHSEPAFPADLLSTTANKTTPNEDPIDVAPKKLFGQDKEARKKAFGNALLETSILKTKNREQKTTEPKTFNKDPHPKSKPIFPPDVINVSPNKTAPNKTKEASEIQGQVRNLFGNRPGTKRKNVFADLIVSESEDEIQDVQPKVFGFTKASKSRGSSVSRGVRDGSPMSVTTDIELDDWKMLPSSTMMVDQLEDMVAGTPVKKIRLSKMSEQKESDDSKAAKNTTTNKSKISNKSVSLKNKSKTIQNRSNSKIAEDEIVIDEIELSKEQYTSKPQTENANVEVVSENKSNVNDDCEAVEVNTNATYNLKNRTHSIHKNTSKLSKTNTEVDQLQPEIISTNDDIQVEVAEYQTKNKSYKDTNIQDIGHEDEEMISLTYEDDDKEPTDEAVQERVAKECQEIDVINNVRDLSTNTTVNKAKQTNAKGTDKSEETPMNGDLFPAIEEPMEIIPETEGVQMPQKQGKNKVTVAENELNINVYADDNFEDPNCDEINLSVLQDEVSEVIQDDDSKVEISVQHIEGEVEELIEEEKKEIDRIEESVENENSKSQLEGAENKGTAVDVEQNLEEKDQDKVEKSILNIQDTDILNVKAAHIEVDIVKQDEDFGQEKDEEDAEVEQNQDEIYQEEEDQEYVEVDKSQENIEEEEEEEENIEVEQSQEDIEENNEMYAEDAEAEQSEEQIEQDEAEEHDETNLEEDEEDETEAAEVEESQIEIEPNEEEVEQSEEQIDEEVEQSEEQIDEEVEQSEEQIDEEVEQSEEKIEEEVEQSEEQIDEEVEQSEEQIEEEVEQSEDQIADDIEHSQEKMVHDDEEPDNDQGIDEVEQETEHDTAEDSHANLPSEQVQTPEPTDEIQESPNVSHDTTGRNRKKVPEVTEINSPEAILKGTTLRNTSYTPQGRNTSVRKTKSMIRPQPKPSLAASIRDSIGTNGSNSSGQGSGWDSHRTTRKTMRQTFGKDFTPRKSLRALVMEKSAQRQTMGNIDVDDIKVPQANSTEINANADMSMPSMVDNVEDLTEEPPSEHEVSRNTRQTTLEMYMKKLKKDTLERRLKIENAVQESLKAPSRDLIKDFNFKIPSKGSGVRKVSKPSAQSKKLIPERYGFMQIGKLPKELIEGLQYKPPKRFKPPNTSWATNRLYKFLESKLEPKYDYMARVRAEKLVATLYSFSKMIQRLDVAPPQSIDQLKHEMARLNVTATHFEFYDFFHEFMPREMRIKVIPDITNKLPMPKYGVDADIIR